MQAADKRKETHTILWSSKNSMQIWKCINVKVDNNINDITSYSKSCVFMEFLVTGLPSIFVYQA